MLLVSRGRVVADRSARTPARGWTIRSGPSRRSWPAALLAWAAPRVIRRGLIDAHHPFARRSDVRCEDVLRLGVLVRDRPGRSETIGGVGHCGRTSRHRPGHSLAAGDARFGRITDRRGRAPLLRFASPSAHAGCGACVRRMPAVRTIPLRRFRRRPARLRANQFRRRPPVRFCARGGAGWCRSLWRTCSGWYRLNAPRERGGSTDDLFPRTSVAVGVLVVRPRADSHRRTRSRSTASIARPHQPAPARAFACPGRRHSPRPFLARGVPDPSRAPQPGRAAWVLPSCRPAALMGFVGPSQVCSRSAGGRAG